MNHQSRRGEYLVTTDKRSLEVTVIHDFLSKSYWAKGTAIEIVQRSITNSLCFGVYNEAQQIGFARVIADYAIFAYLADGLILEPFRKPGLSKWLIETIVSHPDRQGFRRWMLATRDAHQLYRKYGFENLKSPETLMERLFPEVYLQK